MRDNTYNIFKKSNALFYNLRIYVFTTSFLLLLANCKLAGVGKTHTPQLKSKNRLESTQQVTKDTMLYHFKKDNLYGFINKKGKIVVEPQYFKTGVFSEGFCAVTKKVNDTITQGYIDATGNVVIDFKFQSYYDYPSQFIEGIAVVRKNNQMGYINKKGEYIFPPTLFKGHPFNNGYAVIEKEHSIRSIINSKGEILFEPVGKFKKQRENAPKGIERLLLSDKVSDSLITFAVYDYSKKPTKVKMGYFDLNGKMTYPLKYFIGNYSEGLTIIGKTPYKKTAYANKYDEVIIPFGKYSRLTDFKNGRAIVKDNETKRFGVIDKIGNYIIQPKYAKISEHSYFKDIIFVYYDSQKAGYISSSGVPINEEIYRYGYDFHEGLALVSTKDRKYQYINTQGKPAFKLDFRESHSVQGSHFNGGLARVIINDKMTYINKKGEIIFTF